MAPSFWKCVLTSKLLPRNSDEDGPHSRLSKGGHFDLDKAGYTAAQFEAKVTKNKLFYHNQHKAFMKKSNSRYSLYKNRKIVNFVQVQAPKADEGLNILSSAGGTKTARKF